jgi:non-specific serine/threonine protein kinase
VAPPDARARAVLGAGVLAHYVGDEARAVSSLQEGLELCRALADDWGVYFSLGILGILAEDAGDYALAAERLTEALAQARRIDDPAGISHALFHLGIASWGQGDRERAGSLLSEVVAVERAAGDLTYGTADALAFLGILACEEGDLVRSVALQRESLSLHLELDAREDIAVNLAGLGMLAAAGGQPVPAVRLFAAAEAMREAIGNPFKLPERAVFEGAIAALRVGLGEATFAPAWAEGRALPLATAVEEARTVDPGASRPAPAAAGSERGVASPFGLTARELEVLRLLVAGNTDRQIAGALFISPRTAQGHVASIFGKLGVGSRTAAATAAIAAGLVVPGSAAPA